MPIFAKDFMGRGAAPSNGGGDTPAPTAWTRPADWLTLTDPAAGEDKFVGLHAVFPDANFVAFTFAGAYTVDWGDGSAPEDFSSGATAYHEYTYSSISSATESTRGYRQVIVTVTPQAGANLTSMNLYAKHNQSGLVSGYTTGWLDISARLPNLTSLTIGSSGPNVRHHMMEQVKLLENGTVTSFANLFYNCQVLQSVVLEDTAAVTNMSQMFTECYALTSVPLFDTSAVTNMSTMFQTCVSLTSLPLFDTSAVTNMNSMFSNCYSLDTVPLLNTAAVTNMSFMFSGSYSLTSVPLFNTAAVTNMSQMFNNCSSLRTVPLFNTAAVTNMSLMFSNCRSLSTIPALDASAATSSSGYSSMFNNCGSLASNGFTGHKFTFSVASNKMSSAALNTLYTNLATVTTAQTITVSGNYGTAGDDPTIATNKGWTVSG